MNYYKATDGQITAFRATHRVYNSCHVIRGGVSFSRAMPGVGMARAVPITLAAYKELQRIKTLQQIVRGTFTNSGNAPSDSWIDNSDLETLG